ncbi:nucleotidyltransferase family protein [Methylocella tundrae]|uniref:4-diphosphocytidyl-2C-methyl-D-erythritol kinase n=1 Tax=Methylocella tundrae TaxID=227605 RepID=A0A4U8YWC1_METTU
MAEIGAIILAAGRSTRFSKDAQEATKLVAVLRGKPLVRHVAEAALRSVARPIVVVTGHRRAEVEAALQGLDLSFAINPDYAAGLSSSLKRGVAALPTASAGALILLGDMPLVSSALIDRLIAAFVHAADVAPQNPLAAAPRRGGVRGNPVLLSRALFPAVAKLDGDRGARALIDSIGKRLVECDVEDEAPLIDIDTKEALRGLELD